MLLLKRGFSQHSPFHCRVISSTARKLDPPPLLAANVYISEGRDKTLIDRFSKAAECAVPYASLCHVFIDEKYHRTGFTLAGTPAALIAAVYALTTKALQDIDLRTHVKVTHPRTGAVDHIVFHPLPGASDLQLASDTAKALASEVGENCKVPVYLYGAASDTRTPLAELRRALGYFRGAKEGVWSGGLQQASHSFKASSNQLSNPSLSSSIPTSVSDHSTLSPSIPSASHSKLTNPIVSSTRSSSTLSPATSSPNQLSEASSQFQLPSPDVGSFDGFDRSGVVCVGATPWVVNYNIPLECADISEARQMARMVSEREGGLSGVQAMALPHSPGVIEIACNLLDVEAVSPATVQAFVERQAAERGILVMQGYSTGLKPQEILASAKERLGLVEK